MRRRDLLRGSAVLGIAAALRSATTGALLAAPAAPPQPSARPSPLTPPARGAVPVAFLVSEGAEVIDFCGPWEVFQDVAIPGRAESAFELYTVAEGSASFRASGGLRIVPDYTLTNAPAPKVIVIPAQRNHGKPVLEWVRRASTTTDVTMSVCTGAFLLARTGLLAKKPATTYHGAFDEFAAAFPDVELERGARFVESGNLATAGGLSSGIDLALRVVERYYGHDVAADTAFQMEYQGRGWLDPGSNSIYSPSSPRHRDGT